ncbi:MAG: glycerophosphodiester phosphodiesterase [Promethearchaeota archaeon]|jgi:glycerophosphoryl diester phosphodiesterase
MNKTIIWGHRGAGFRGVENSLSSFKKAVDMGVDGIKTEAQLLKDGEIVLKFLPFVIIEGIKLPLKDLNLEDIKHVRLENNESIPTLCELFDEFKDSIRYNFDIFEVDTGLKIIDIAEEYGLLDKIEITKPVAHTKAAETLFAPLRKRYKDIKLVCSLFTDTQISQENYKLLDKMEKLHIQVINLNHHRFNLEVFKRVKRAGFKFYLWGVLFKYFMKKYLTLNYEGGGIDGIYTNYPDKLIQLRTNILTS